MPRSRMAGAVHPEAVVLPVASTGDDRAPRAVVASVEVDAVRLDPARIEQAQLDALGHR